MPYRISLCIHKRTCDKYIKCKLRIFKNKNGKDKVTD